MKHKNRNKENYYPIIAHLIYIPLISQTLLFRQYPKIKVQSSTNLTKTTSQFIHHPEDILIEKQPIILQINFVTKNLLVLMTLQKYKNLGRASSGVYF